jgi:hypothetical protein
MAPGRVWIMIFLSEEVRDGGREEAMDQEGLVALELKSCEG